MPEPNFNESEFLRSGEYTYPLPETTLISPRGRLETLIEEQTIPANDTKTFTANIKDGMTFWALKIYAWAELPVTVKWRPDNKGDHQRTFSIFKPRDIAINPTEIVAEISVIEVTNNNALAVNFAFEIQGFNVPEQKAGQIGLMSMLNATALPSIDLGMSFLRSTAADISSINCLNLAVMLELHRDELPADLVEEIELEVKRVGEKTELVRSALSEYERVLGFRFECELPKYTRIGKLGAERKRGRGL